jgi:hypothetical protein
LFLIFLHILRPFIKISTSRWRPGKKTNASQNVGKDDIWFQARGATILIQVKNIWIL